jgi:hypothetical protein
MRRWAALKIGTVNPRPPPMSYSETSSLAVLRQQHLTTIYGGESSMALTGEQIPASDPRPGHFGAGHRYQTIHSRGGWVQDRLQVLGTAAGTTGLRFLSGEESTQRVRSVIRDNDEQPVWTETHGYTVLTDRCDELLSSAEQVQAWCLQQPAKAGKLLGYDKAGVLEALRAASFSLAPDNEGYGEGDTPEFVFCVLRTMIELLRFARFHTRTDPALWVVYHRVLASGPP